MPDAEASTPPAKFWLAATRPISNPKRRSGRITNNDIISHVKAEFLVVSFSSDWLYPTAESKEIVKALQANGVPTTFLEIINPYGHDAFLLPNEELATAVSGFLAHVYARVRQESTRELVPA